MRATSSTRSRAKSTTQEHFVVHSRRMRSHERIRPSGRQRVSTQRTTQGFGTTCTLRRIAMFVLSTSNGVFGNGTNDRSRRGSRIGIGLVALEDASTKTGTRQIGSGGTSPTTTTTRRGCCIKPRNDTGESCQAVQSSLSIVCQTLGERRCQGWNYILLVLVVVMWDLFQIHLYICLLYCVLYINIDIDRARIDFLDDRE
mmetsp:Transcript_13897/g.22366  ORF Transcript_13897/g.22366 Transcript_13897/m.22366 type:complete len:200 (+) Transcript_13897:530-1129(+)